MQTTIGSLSNQRWCRGTTISQWSWGCCQNDWNTRQERRSFVVRVDKNRQFVALVPRLYEAGLRSTSKLYDRVTVPIWTKSSCTVSMTGKLGFLHAKTAAIWDNYYLKWGFQENWKTYTLPIYRTYTKAQTESTWAHFTNFPTCAHMQHTPFNFMDTWKAHLLS